MTAKTIGQYMSEGRLGEWIAKQNRRKEMSLHRRIILPYNEVGICRLCGLPVQKPRKCWHKTCNELYLLTFPSHQRFVCFNRDKGVCNKCGKDGGTSKGEWEADHIIPLKDGGGFEESNLQTLCAGCHKEKTKKEAQERARKRKQEANA